MSPVRRASTADDQEAARWKQKFLDALDEHEQREKSLQHRIRTLRRGLLGVSLAGDGVDPKLDRQLEQLRKLLRKSDHESGLEALLEQIEASVLRLDTGRQEESAALRQALDLSLRQLQGLDLPRDRRRQLRQFARQHRRGAGSDESLQQDVAGFIALLRGLVVDVLAESRHATPRSSTRSGFWSRLTGATDGRAQAAADVTPSPEPDPGPDPEAASGPEPAMVGNPETDLTPETEPEPEPRMARLNPRPDVAEPEAEQADEAESAPDDSVQGELLRGGSAGGSGLAEPGFSYIADHVEPLLLRILENIHIAGQSLRLAESVRDTVQRGLNWYDFVAVLEDLVTLISQSRDEERGEFQQFLRQLNENLDQVRSALSSTDQARAHSRDSSEQMDSRMRHSLDEMSRSVEESQDLDQLKQSVRGQLDSIIEALDDHRGDQEGHSQGLEQELRVLTRRISAMEDESRHLREYLSRQQENALRDKLTGLYNRDAWDRRIRDVLEARRHAEGREPRGGDADLCLAVCDLDHFKEVNDRFGHLAGDRVLKVLARELQTRLRDSDFVARYGGEEFVILLTDTTLEQAGDVLEALRHVVEQMPFHFRDDNVPVTVSFGIAAWQPGDTPDRLFERADRALYRAKAAGRNRCEVEPGQ
ncbi:MAG: diguanylate cyclase [Pseudomonadota bacterium]